MLTCEVRTSNLLSLSDLASIIYINLPFQSFHSILDSCDHVTEVSGDACFKFEIREDETVLLSIIKTYIQTSASNIKQCDVCDFCDIGASFLNHLNRS